MRKLFKKLLSIFVIAIFGLMAARPVFANGVSGYFSDLESSTENVLSTTTLDFSLSKTDNTPLSSPFFNLSSFKPGDSASESARIKKDGELDFLYNISAVQSSGDSGLCNALQIEAKLDGATQYTGSLTGLNLAPPVTITSDQDDWTFIVSLASSDPSLKNKTCSFNIIYQGWQTDSDGTWGFTDEETLSNSVSTGTWISSGDVVINEVMWMGSSESTSDEWIELRNTTDQEIDLSNWRIDGAVTGAGGHLEIPASYKILANGFFLIANYAADSTNSALSVQADLVTASLSLNNDYNSNGALVLKDKNRVVIDSTPTPLSAAWPAGTNSTEKQSMERNDDPSTGWHTCISSGCRSTAYWDSEGNNWGTPKAPNLSANDPSSPDFSPSPEVSTSVSITSENTTSDLAQEPVESTPSAEPTPTPTENPDPEPTIIPETTPIPAPEETEGSDPV